jgi:alpha/beta hydrolase fold
VNCCSTCPGPAACQRAGASVAGKDFSPGFDTIDIDVDGARIHAVTAGSGPPELLLHGFPQSHVCWRKVAATLAKHAATLIIPDLPGYGDSIAPGPDVQHIECGKRGTARRMLELMDKLGHIRLLSSGTIATRDGVTGNEMPTGGAPGQVCEDRQGREHETRCAIRPISLRGAAVSGPAAITLSMSP